MAIPSHQDKTMVLPVWERIFWVEEACGGRRGGMGEAEQAVEGAGGCPFPLRNRAPPTPHLHTPLCLCVHSLLPKQQREGGEEPGEGGRAVQPGSRGGTAHSRTAQRLWNARHPGHPRLRDYWLQRGAKNSLALAPQGAETPPGRLPHAPPLLAPSNSQ